MQAYQEGAVLVPSVEGGGTYHHREGGSAYLQMGYSIAVIQACSNIDYHVYYKCC